MAEPGRVHDPVVEIGSARAGVVLREGARLIRSYIARAPRTFWTAVAGASLYAVMLVLGTEVIGRATDEVIIPTFEDGGQPGSTWWIVGLLVGASLLRSVGVILRRFFGAMTTERNNRALRRRLAQIYLQRSLSELRARPTGELLAHADTDVEVSTMVLQPLPFTMSMVVLAVAAMVSLFSVDPWMLLVAFLVFPATWLANRIFTQRVIEPASQVRAAVGDVTAVVHESVDGALVVKTLGREDAETDRLRGPAAHLRDTRIRIGRLRASLEPALDMLPNLGMIAVLAIGAWRVSEGGASTGEVVQAMVLFQQLAFPMRIVGFFLEENATSVVAARRLQRVFDLPVAGRFGGDLDLPDGPLGLRVDDLSFSHGDDVVLDHCSFDVAPGEVVALVGGTGSGKTTIAQLLFGLVEPAGGSIALGGVHLGDVDADVLRRRASLVSQETFLFADSVFDNVVLGRSVDEADAHHHASTARAQFIDELAQGWDTVLGERGVTLSGGQRQRVALARALVGDPGFLLLDDSTSAVDPVVEQEILDGLAVELATTTLIVAHRVSTIELADRVLFLQDGRIRASGSHRELLDVDAYAELVKAYEEAGR
ncbi:MAG: ABC transporter ATP-binding protein [Actinomycetota bacterium]|jgi:ATP-binding cassette, subfamily B, bacterial|nr:ABC transporter ATP-binding protein [Actinomycetota bacterium]